MKEKCGEAGGYRLYFRGQKFSREEAQVNRQPETANACSSHGPTFVSAAWSWPQVSAPSNTHSHARTTQTSLSPQWRHILMHRCI